MTKQATRTRDSDPKRMRLQFHYDVDLLGRHIAVWSEEWGLARDWRETDESVNARTAGDGRSSQRPTVATTKSPELLPREDLKRLHTEGG